MKPEIVRAHNMFRVPVWMTDHRPGWMADNRPVWMTDHRPGWMADNRPEWMTDHRPGWMADEVPEDIVKALSDLAEGMKG
jgi:hypothetical protein